MESSNKKDRVKGIAQKLSKLRSESFGINVLSFWILGLCNNFAYIVMLSAAHDILETTTVHKKYPHKLPENFNTSLKSLVPPHPSLYDCNSISTGAILLADILPTLILKTLAPFCLIGISYNIRISFVITFGFLALLIVSVAISTWEGIMGVVFASLSTGLGDYSFLCLSSYYHHNILSAWASGTGAAGLFGSLSYAGLISLGLSSQNSLLIMLFVPMLMGVAFFWLLNKPSYNETLHIDDPNQQTPGLENGINKTPKRSLSTTELVKDNDDAIQETPLPTTDSSKNISKLTKTPSSLYPELRPSNIEKTPSQTSNAQQNETGLSKSTTQILPPPPPPFNLSSSSSSAGNNNKRTPLLLSTKSSERLSFYNTQRTFDFKERSRHIWHLLPYMLPLSIVYFAEYFINQGLFELTYFRNIWLDHASQYRWYLVTYQLGVFISRSSFKIVPMPYLWIFPCLQVLNLIIFLLNVTFFYIPTIWIVFGLIFFEGFIGGAAYVNTFHKIAYDHEDSSEREFALGAASLADTMGISLAGFVSLPVHNFFCAK